MVRTNSTDVLRFGVLTGMTLCLLLALNKIKSITPATIIYNAYLNGGLARINESGEPEILDCCTPVNHTIFFPGSILNTLSVYGFISDFNR